MASFLNIYCNYAYDASKSDDVFEFKSVAENCRTFELQFLPFQLTHCKTKARNTDPGNNNHDDLKLRVVNSSNNVACYYFQNLKMFFKLSSSSLAETSEFMSIHRTRIGGNSRKKIWTIISRS